MSEGLASQNRGKRGPGRLAGQLVRLARLAIALLALVLSVPVTCAPWLIPTRRARDRWLCFVRRHWGRVFLAVVGVRVHVQPPGVEFAGPALYVANHTGYLDILVLLSVAPGVFISREGIVWWPVIGQLMALVGTVFVDRRDRLSIGRTVAKVRKCLDSGVSVVFFPEGTSSNGDGLLPFKTPIFAAAEGNDGAAIPIRPLVLSYRKIGGEPIDESNRDRVYWYGDMELLRHVWQLLLAPGIDVMVKPLPERTVSGRRSEFAKSLRADMERELAELGRGA